MEGEEEQKQSGETVRRADRGGWQTDANTNPAKGSAV